MYSLLSLIAPIRPFWGSERRRRRRLARSLTYSRNNGKKTPLANFLSFIALFGSHFALLILIELRKRVDDRRTIDGTLHGPLHNTAEFAIKRSLLFQLFYFSGESFYPLTLDTLLCLSSKHYEYEMPPESEGSREGGTDHTNMNQKQKREKEKEREFNYWTREREAESERKGGRDGEKGRGA